MTDTRQDGDPPLTCRGCSAPGIALCSSCRDAELLEVRRRLWAWLRRHFRHLPREDREDLLGAAMLAAVRLQRRFRTGRGQFASLAVAVVGLKLRRYASRAARPPALPLRGEEASAPSAPITDWDGLLAPLPARQRRLVLLRYRDGLSEADAARGVGLGPCRARVLLKAALATLRAKLTPPGGPEADS